MEGRHERGPTSALQSGKWGGRVGRELAPVGIEDAAGVCDAQSVRRHSNDEHCQSTDMHTVHVCLRCHAAAAAAAISAARIDSQRNARVEVYRSSLNSLRCKILIPHEKNLPRGSAHTDGE